MPALPKEPFCIIDPDNRDGPPLIIPGQKMGTLVTEINYYHHLDETCSKLRDIHSELGRIANLTHRHKQVEALSPLIKRLFQLENLVSAVGLSVPRIMELERETPVQNDPSGTENTSLNEILFSVQDGVPIVRNVISRIREFVGQQDHLTIANIQVDIDQAFEFMMTGLLECATSIKQSIQPSLPQAEIPRVQAG